MPRTELERGQNAISPRGGLVRGTRRPPGWIAPGPSPRPPADRAALWPDADEDLCWLAGDWRLLQRTDGHRFSLDDLVTAWFATRVAARPTVAPRMLDLGCGIGTVLLLLAWRFPDVRVLGVEAQAVSAALARRSIAWNGAGDRCRVVSGDLRDPLLLESETPFDLITGTPPYFPRGTGIESEQIQRGPCRFEHRGGIEDYCVAAARHLGSGAAFVGCAAATQVDRVIAAAAAAGLAVERLRDVVPRAGKAPLVLLFSMRRAADHPTATIVEPPLVVRDAAGRRTDEFVAVRREMGMPP
jgi:tRNA1Val (adenine37-N6)-methyltransferase